MKETGGRWRKGEGRERESGDRTVIKMRAEEKAHVRNKQRLRTCVSSACVRACVCACVCMCVCGFELPAVCCVFAGDKR